jgi:hypothetical protein
MSPDSMPPKQSDLLLQRYREASALDTARPGAALRETVLAHARQAASERPVAAVAPANTAANDSVWTWKAFGSLAVMGLVGLLVLQFDRGSPEEKETAFGTAPTPAPAARAPAAEPPSAPTSDSPQPASASASAPRPTPPEALRAAPARPSAAERGKTTAVVPTPTPVETADTAAPPPSAPATLHQAAPSAVALPLPLPAEAPAAPPPPKAAATPVLAEASVADAATDKAMDTPRALARERQAVTAAAPLAPSPLLIAIASDDPERVRQRLADGADPNQRDGAARTPLMAAAQRGNAEIVRLLLSAGADPALRDAQGLSAADLARRAGHAALLPLLP